MVRTEKIVPTKRFAIKKSAYRCEPCNKYYCKEYYAKDHELQPCDYKKLTDGYKNMCA